MSSRRFCFLRVHAISPRVCNPLSQCHTHTHSSLVALSLILALLRFQPAPLYVLDEIDSALDLSHTQNIGRVIRKYFTGSQFIIVSLKEGLFRNAAVLYRISFRDGCSHFQVNRNKQVEQAPAAIAEVSERDDDDATSDDDDRTTRKTGRAKPAVSPRKRKRAGGR